MYDYEPDNRTTAFCIVALIAAAIAAVLLFALAAHSQESTDHRPASVPVKSPRTSTGFLLLQLANATATAADCSATNHLIQSGPQFRESNPLLGARPSPPRISLTCGALFGGVTWASYAARVGNHRRWWVVPPLIGIVVHSAAFARNRSLYPHPQAAIRSAAFSAIPAPRP
jgi:hypothetical protein